MEINPNKVDIYVGESCLNKGQDNPYVASGWGVVIESRVASGAVATRFLQGSIDQVSNIAAEKAAITHALQDVYKSECQRMKPKPIITLHTGKESMPRHIKKMVQDPSDNDRVVQPQAMNRNWRQGRSGNNDAASFERIVKLVKPEAVFIDQKKSPHTNIFIACCLAKEAAWKKRKEKQNGEICLSGKTFKGVEADEAIANMTKIALLGLTEGVVGQQYHGKQ